jgi:ribosomal protein L17
MLRTPNFGRKSLNEIKEVLARWVSISAWRSRIGRRRTSKSWPSASKSRSERRQKVRRRRCVTNAAGASPVHRSSQGDVQEPGRALIKHEQITTTLHKAKDLRPVVEKLVTLGKKGSAACAPSGDAFLRDRRGRQALFDVLAPRYAKRAGGYLRVLKAGFRFGDAARWP